MVYLAAVLGLRWSEVAGLRVDAIDFLRRTINVTTTTAEVEGVLMERAPVKTKAPLRSVSAPVELVDMLAEQLRAHRANRAGRVGVPSAAGWSAAGREVPHAHLATSRRRGRVGRLHLPLAPSFQCGVHGGRRRAPARHSAPSRTRLGVDDYGRLRQVLPEVDQSVAGNLGALFRDPEIKEVGLPAGSQGVERLRPPQREVKSVQLNLWWR